MTRDSDEFMKETIQNHTAEIKRFMQDQDVDAFGIARMADYGKEIVQLDKAFVEKFPFAISFGLVLSRSVMETVKEGPNALYLHHYRQLNYRLDMIAYLLSREIEKKGNRALPFAASQLVDWKNQKGHISHKRVAEISGLGWIGRNNLLINPIYGARMRFNTVLTDMPLEESGLLERDCGCCKACVGVCPAGAIKETPADFDHIGCYNMVTQLKNKRNLGHHICGICIAACTGEQ
jgi:epoxyqueuosine reductase QueG